MEQLLDQADAMVHLAVTTGEQQRPNFPIPQELSTVPSNDHIEIRDDPWKGRGWFATTDIPVGQLVLIAKPIATVMDWQEYDEGDDANDDDEENDDVEPLMNELLLIETLQKVVNDPNVWHTQLSTLFPRNDSDLSTLPAWVCHNDDVFIQVEDLLKQLDERNKTFDASLILPVKDISTRLPLIVRYNVLSMETCAELLSYPSPNVGHSSLAGIALYHEPSFFNHSKKPNINRWCVGDVMGFVSNQPIMTGTELCISYIEHDVLCEPPYRRNMMMSMDFLDTDDSDDTGAATVITPVHDDEEDDETVTTNSVPISSTASALQPPIGGPEAPVIDSDVQNELMAMVPHQRLTAIEDLMLQAKGLKLPTDTNDDDNETNQSQQHHSNNNNNNNNNNNGTSSFNESGSTMDMTESLPSISIDGNNNTTTTAADNTGNVITTPWFQCDVHNLRILKAITLDGLNISMEAYTEWQASITFVQDYLPPNDESLVVLHVQAALCAYHCYCKDFESSINTNANSETMYTIAKEHANRALEIHHIVFGSPNISNSSRNITLLRRRYRNEFQLKLRPTITMDTSRQSSNDDPVDILWPL